MKFSGKGWIRCRRRRQSVIWHWIMSSSRRWYMRLLHSLRRRQRTTVCISSPHKSTFSIHHKTISNTHKFYRVILISNYIIISNRWKNKKIHRLSCVVIKVLWNKWGRVIVLISGRRAAVHKLLGNLQLVHNKGLFRQLRLRKDFEINKWCQLHQIANKISKVWDQCPKKVVATSIQMSISI